MKGFCLVGKAGLYRVTADANAASRGGSTHTGPERRDHLSYFPHKTDGSKVTDFECLMSKVCFPNNHAIFEKEIG